MKLAEAIQRSVNNPLGGALALYTFSFETHKTVNAVSLMSDTSHVTEKSFIASSRDAAWVLAAHEVQGHIPHIVRIKYLGEARIEEE